MNKFEQTIALFQEQMKALKTALKFNEELAAITEDVTDANGATHSITTDKWEVGGVITMADGSALPDGTYKSAAGYEVEVVAGVITSYEVKEDMSEEAKLAKEEADKKAKETALSTEGKLETLETSLGSITEVLGTLAKSIETLTTLSNENKEANVKLTEDLKLANETLEKVTLGKAPEKFEKQTKTKNVYADLASVLNKK